MRNLWDYAFNPSIFVRKALAKALARIYPSWSQGRTIRINDVKFELPERVYTIDSNRHYSLMAMQVYEWRECLVIRRILKPGDIFIDVGANIGYVSAIAASIVGRHGKEFSFEPVLAYYERLCRLKDLNPDFSITPINLALGEEQREVIIQINENNLGGSTVIPGLLKNPPRKEQVMMDTLDHYFADKINRITMIKVDTEGNEYSVLQGGVNLFRKFRPWVLCEVMPSAFPLCGHSIKHLFDFMKNLDYTPMAVSGGYVDPERINLVTNILFCPGECENQD
jgi:FkbM family methyltransferase